MKDFFSLQHRIIDRKLIEFGVRPLIGYILAIITFALLVFLLYEKSALAKYILVLLYIATLAPLSEKRRNDFLKTTFPVADYIKLRTIENLIIAIPFSLALLIKLDLLVIPILVAFSFILARTQLKSNLSVIIPSPFSKHPFEFSVGFRKMYYFFPIVYMLTIISIYVGNENLGIFAILMIYAVCLFFYTNMENEYYIWSYAYSPVNFLLKKIKTASSYALIATAPVIVSLACAFPDYIMNIIVFSIIGLAYLTTTILAKYSAYPNNMSLPQTIVMLACIILPPIMLFVIPSLFRRSVDRLKVLLE